MNRFANAFTGDQRQNYDSKFCFSSGLPPSKTISYTGDVESYEHNSVLRYNGPSVYSVHSEPTFSSFRVHI